MRIYTNLEKITISESLNLESFEGEEWKTIIDYSFYQISNYARVKSLYKEVIRIDGQFQPYHERILKQAFDDFGYKRISLVGDNNKRKTKKIHRLVAKAFIPNPENKPQVNHKKEIKHLNWFDELEWNTVRENCNHGTRNKRMKKTSTNGKLSKEIAQLNLDGTFVRYWKSAHEARRNGYCNKAISNVINKKNRYKSHAGYKWAFRKDWEKRLAV